MRRIRGSSGIGDALYVRPFVEHFARLGERLIVCTSYPDVFLGTDAKFEPFTRLKIDIVATYTLGKNNPATTQWQDVCACAGVNLPLQIQWQPRNQALVQELRAKANGRPLALVHGGRVPMGRTDGFGKELLPQRRAFEAALAELADCYTVRIGKGADLYPLPVSLDLNGLTSVPDLIDLGQSCDGVVGQCSFAVPLAEVFDKPLMAVWAEKGMKAQQAYVRQITPQKVLSKETSSFVIDNWTDEQIREEVRAFRLTF